MKFEWITDWETIWSDDFVKQWQEWMKNASNGHVFFHPTMAKAWVETYMPLRKIKPLFCIAHHKDTTIFLPLVLWEKNWKNAFINAVVPVGYSDFDYHDPLVIGNDTISWEVFWNKFFDAIEQIWGNDFDTIETDGIRKNSIGVSDTWQEGEACPFIDLTPYSSGEEFLQSLKKNLRQDTRRRVRRMEESGECKFEVFKPTEIEQALEALKELLPHHILRWPNAYKAPNFHINLIKELLPVGLLHFSRIIIDGKTISWRIGFIFDSRYYSYMPTFDIAYNKLSPGKVHLLYCIDDAIKKDIKIYDQLRGAELYKNEWTQTIDTVWTYKEISKKPISQIKYKLNKLKNALKN